MSLSQQLLREECLVCVFPHCYIIYWCVTEALYKPDVAVLSQCISRLVDLSIIHTWTTGLIDTASCSIWHQAFGTHAAWCTAWTYLHPARKRMWAKQCLCLMRSTSVNVYWFFCLHNSCLDCHSSWGTLSQGSQVERWSSRSKPWGQCMMMRLGNKCQHVLLSCQNSLLYLSQPEINS